MLVDWSQCPVVETVPGKLNGAWVIRGTRMPVKLIFENLEAGATIDEIVEWYPGISKDQVKSVVAFASRTLERVPA